ncbi:hypothetical protein SLEP1_g34616 [Rubroshorea leprosula]|uniref:Uncharacterized protein n=1 Tax=Rubroshorea leprosula TaxID=152421 RepID=A0AAV5KKR9_9ROSI|nr:hypothetical protein SLEP1_g34616 [Rubroshorea leprosula]
MAIDSTFGILRFPRLAEDSLSWKMQLDFKICGV